MVRDVLASYLGGFCKGAGAFVSIEPLLGQTRRADILMKNVAQGVVRILDVGITAAFLTMLQVEDMDVEASSGLMETNKRLVFARKLLDEAEHATGLAREAADGGGFIPFILDATGRFGKEALRFLEGLPKRRGVDYTITELMNELSAVMNQAGAQMRLNGILRAEHVMGVAY